MEIKHIDREKFPPIATGMGAAWQQDLPAGIALSAQRNGGTPRPHSSLAGWIIFAPWANMMWSYYWLHVIHLRDVPGAPPCKINLPGATHEVWLFALDPHKEPSLIDPYPTALHGANFIGQWICESDEKAVAYVETCVVDILRGTLSPDTDFRRQWSARFSNSNMRY